MNVSASPARPERPFTVETFNGHDNARVARSATFVGLQERGPVPLFTEHMSWWRPEGLQEALGWDPTRFDLDDKGREFLHKGGVDYGHPNTTPPRWALWVAGVLDGLHKVAVINTHLINNAWGKAIRGERRLRRRLWRKGWAIVKRLRRRLERLGYAVFIIGDLNRPRAFWDSARRCLGAGFDRIFYPLEVDNLEAWTGDANGSDHRPLFGRFVFRRRAAGAR